MHRCRLEQSPPPPAAGRFPAVFGMRAVCVCGWAGTWWVSGRRAVDESLEHFAAVAPPVPW